MLLTYKNWIKGERKENLEPIIDAFRTALEIYNRQNFPVEWARTQYVLGIVYCARVEGERKRNIEQAIDAFRAALEVYSFSDFLFESEKIDVGLAAYYALKGFLCPGFPLECSTIQDDLEIACYDILAAECEVNLEQAIQLHQTDLGVRSSQNFPIQQATAQNELDDVDRNQKVQFLLESLQLIADSQGNPERVS